MEIWSFSRARNVWVKPWIDCYFDDTHDIGNVNIFVDFCQHFYRLLSTYSVIKRIVNRNFFFLLRDLYIESIQVKLTVAQIWLYLWRPRVVTHWLLHFWTWLICLSGHSWNYFPGSICDISEFKISIQNSRFHFGSFEGHIFLLPELYDTRHIILSISLKPY